MGDDGKKAEADSSSNNTASAVSASSSSENDADFDMENLFKYFDACYGEDGSTLSMDSYIKGYEEIVKFLNLLGTVFGWVASDVVAKIGDVLQWEKTQLNLNCCNFFVIRRPDGLCYVYVCDSHGMTA